ncbi:HEAT repeat-containing protein 4 isoform X2 [Rhinatrema bivittatum]|uniref:HEAT repeat-containing protein 4 isoform X2 n=1 Tax=Rhinatrema bivittatum TaxID=194408 RepID=UPI00112D374C|nr:HEAT repeat-containing protein 4 isoform X2 [Rhinatrema bivittatum]
MPITESTKSPGSSTKHGTFCTVVQLPQVDDLSADFLHPRNVSESLINIHKPPQHVSTCLPAEYLKKMASDLNFSLEVVQLRALPSLSYKEWDTKHIYNTSEIITGFKRKGHIPKMQLKTDPPKHQLCHMKHAVPHTKRAVIKYSPVLGNTLFKIRTDDSQIISSSLSVSSLSGAEALDTKTFLTQLPESSSSTTKTHMQKGSEIHTPMDQSSEWYDVVLKKLTKNTVQWIVSQQMGHCATRDQLRQRYNLSNVIDLITDKTMTEMDFKVGQGKEKASVEDDLVKDRKPETPLPVYYKVLPRWGNIVQDETSSRNKTADEISVKQFKPSPPVKLQDVMNPRAGKTIYTTENIFEHELYSGAGKIVYQRDAAKDRITLTSHNEYIKHLQECFPTSSEKWSLSETPKVSGQKPVKGVSRWIALPSPVDNLAEMNSKSPVTKIMKEQQLKEKSMIFSLPENLHILWNMVKDWKKAWLLNNPKSVPDVPQELQPLITAALEDRNPRVRIAAAICHYALRLKSNEARKIMQEALHHGIDADSWAAAQCLASEGNATSPVVNRILDQFFDVRKTATKEQACLLLSLLSKGTRLVHNLLAEGMNSSSWRQRLLACQAVSHLHGNVSQDFKNKLINLMWKDWNTAVRQAAAQALGSLGLGKEVHDHLRERLETGDSAMKVEALCLIGKLKLMTAKLFPGFLQCFSDDFMAVRKEACITAGVLQIKDEMVLEHLFQLMRRDCSWKVKVLAIKALGQIGQMSARLKEVLLWAVRHESHPKIRIQACRSIVALQLQGIDVQAILQKCLLLEPHPLVRKELNEALGTFIFVPVQSEMIQKIQSQLSLLCQKNNVIARVKKLEEIIENEREQADRIIFKKQDIKDKIEGFKDLAGLLGASFSGQSHPSTLKPAQNTWTIDTALQKLMEHPSRPSTQETQMSKGSRNDHKKLYVRGRSATRRKGKQCLLSFLDSAKRATL